MIALWMLLAVVVGALVTLAAVSVERALRLVGRPARWVWAVALGLSVGLPTLSLLPDRAPEAPAAPAGGRLSLDPAILEREGAADAVPAGWLAGGAIAAPEGWHLLDRPLTALWLAATVVLGLRTAVAGRRLSRRLRRWPATTAAGAPVRVAPDLGPAVFGALRPEVIVPAWALADPRLPLMLAHEVAHVRARDPLLLAAGLAAAVLVPWNPAAWWQLRRLRLAVELDCDARVLTADGARSAAVHDYGTLLLDVARHAPATSWPALATLSPTLLATPSTLSRRIHAMTSPRPPRAARTAAALSAGAALLLAAACELPRPTGPRAQPDVALARITAPVAARVPLDRPVTVEDMRSALQVAMPEALVERRGATQRLWIVQAPDGRVRTVMRGTAEAGPGIGMRDVTVSEAANGGYVRMAPEGGLTDASPMRIPADDVAAVEVRKVGAGVLLADSTEAIWIRLKGTAPTTASAPQRRVDATAVVLPRDSGQAPARVALRGGTVTIQPTDSARRAGVGPTTLSVRSANDTTGPKPLYLVDGVEIDGAPASVPAPDRIAAINVIKGEAATRKYGVRAAGGAIEITTKRD